MTALKRVYDGLCAMDAFERGYRQGTRRTAPIGTPPPQTVEYLSRGPGYRGRDRGGDEIDEENDVDAVYEKIAPRIREALYSFQEEGVRFALRRRGRALIADQMGVGKTLQAIAIADAYRDAGPLLCVVPAAMRFVWADELERWLTDMTPRQLSVIFGSSDKFMLDKLAATRRRRDERRGGNRRGRGRRRRRKRRDERRGRVRDRARHSSGDVRGVLWFVKADYSTAGD